MSVNPLLESFNRSVSQPFTKAAAETSCTARLIGKRVYQAVAVAFSGVGNWPFYGVARSFGARYSAGLGVVLGGCEFVSYFVFRVRNFEEIRQKLFTVAPESKMAAAPSTEKKNPQFPAKQEDLRLLPVTSEEEKLPILSQDSLKSDPVEITPPSRCQRCKAAVAKVGIAALGLIAQFPIMVLVYYGNGRNLIYPLISGVCEASFTILSLLLSFESSKKPVECSELERNRAVVVEQIGRFLEELPSKYNDLDFATKIGEICSENPEKSEEERGEALLRLMFEAKGLPEVKQGAWNGKLMNFSKGIGLFISLYLTVVNGFVSYEGVKAWKNDQEVLAVFTAIVVSLANIKLLTKLCVNAGASYYEGLRDIIKKQYRPSLACVTWSGAWFMGRLISNVLSWASFGTTAMGARNYIPKAGNALIGPAPLSSALLLSENLNAASDDLLLWSGSKFNPKAKKFQHIHNVTSAFKERVEGAYPQILEIFLNHLSKLGLPTPSFSARTPLLANQVAGGVLISPSGSSKIPLPGEARHGGSS